MEPQGTDKPYWFELIEIFLGKVAYLGTVGVVLTLIIHNHSDNVPIYIEILKDLILIGLPSPVSRR